MFTHKHMPALKPIQVKALCVYRKRLMCVTEWHSNSNRNICFIWKTIHRNKNIQSYGLHIKFPYRPLWLAAIVDDLCNREWVSLAESRPCEHFSIDYHQRWWSMTRNPTQTLPFSYLTDPHSPCCHPLHSGRSHGTTLSGMTLKSQCVMSILPLPW